MADSKPTVEPSAWVQRWAHLAPERVPVLDLACGAGRHAWFFLRTGYPVTAVDRDISRVEGLAVAADRGDFRAIEADLEDGSPWPLTGETFGAVIVTNYLHRPLFSDIEDAVTPGGVLIYETFAAGNARLGKPSNPDFLLQPGELLAAFPSLTTIAYEHGEIRRPKPAMVQRIVAIRPDTDGEIARPLDPAAVANRVHES